MSCDDFLHEYLQELEAGREPYPVFFSERNCQGNRFPSTNDIPHLDTTFDRDLAHWPKWEQIHSLYVPANISVRFRTNKISNLSQGEYTINGPFFTPSVQGTLSLRFAQWDTIGNNACPTDTTLVSACSPLKLCLNGPSNLEDCTEYCWGCVNNYECTGKAEGNCAPSSGNLITTGSVGSIRMARTETFQNIKFQACTNQVPLKVMDDIVERYRPQSTFCDAFMEDYCALYPTISECSCFVGEKTVKGRFPHSEAPVTCLDMDCRHNLTAYKTRAMLNENCSKDQCESIVCHNRALFGNSTVIQCGDCQFPLSSIRCKVDPEFIWITLAAVGIIIVIFAIAVILSTQ